MFAAPFLWNVEKSTLHWKDLDYAGKVFNCHATEVPRTVAALSAQLDDDAIRQRERALGGLSWDGSTYRLEYRVNTLDGREVWVEERGLRLSGEDQQPHMVMGVVHDINTRKQEELEAGYLRSYDKLTGLKNVSRLSEDVRTLLAYGKHFDGQAAFFLLRLTNLADINSAYGYEVGDLFAKLFADRLKDLVDLPDVVGRVSGSSFGVCMNAFSGSDIQATGETLVRRLTAKPFKTAAGDLMAEVALSGTLMPAQAISAEDAIHQCRLAMDQSLKNDGAFVQYQDGMTGRLSTRIRREVRSEDILGALNERRVTLAYQPVVHARSREVHHYECLLRIRQHNGEVMQFGGFIEAAERLGHIHLLDRRALEIASVTLEKRPDLRLALNVSAATVKDPKTSAGYIEALKALGPMAARLTLELTETVALEDPGLASHFAGQASALGCDFAIDDFGAGYTTFRNLLAIEADEIKIDGAFIRDLSVTPHKQMFVRMMVDLAQTFSVRTVAEWVTTSDDAELLARLGVDYLQGYLFGAPDSLPDWSEAEHDVRITAN